MNEPSLMSLNLAVCYWLVEVMIGSKHKQKLLFLYIDDI